MTATTVDDVAVVLEGLLTELRQGKHTLAHEQVFDKMEANLHLLRMLAAQEEVKKEQGTDVREPDTWLMTLDSLDPHSATFAHEAQQGKRTALMMPRTQWLNMQVPSIVKMQVTKA